MLTQLAAATAANGTKRPNNGGKRLARLFSDKAVTSAPDVAKQYDFTNCLFVIFNQIFSCDLDMTLL